jgi:hypothetical protein
MKQEDNYVAITNNLSVDQKDQQFVTSRGVSQSKERHASHKTPQAILIIPREVQIGET